MLVNESEVSLQGKNYKLVDRVKRDRFGGLEVASSLSAAIESAEAKGEGLIVAAEASERACVERHAAALKIDLGKQGVRFVD